jgi:hypothetical protein
MLALSLLLTVAFIGGIAWFVTANLQEFKEIWRQPISKTILFLLPLAWLLMIFINSELLRQCLYPYGLKLTIIEGLALTMVTSAVNYVIPLKSGSGFRGVYLTVCRGMTVTNFVAVLLCVCAMTLTTASFFAFAGLIKLVIDGHPANALVLGYFSTTTLAGLLAVLFLGRLPFKLPKRLTALAKGWDLLRSTPGLFWTLLRLQVAFFLSWALLNWLSLAAFNVYLRPSELFFYSAGQIHTTIVNLTPAGLGVVEAFSVYAGRVLEFTPAQAISAQALSRLTAVALLAVFGLWGWFYLNKLIRKSKSRLQPAADADQTFTSPSGG